jgi:GTPase involved in cell partitioning and DNA repair
LKQLYNEVKEAIGPKNFLPFIVGNKSDLYEKEAVSKSDSEEYAKSIEAGIRYISALNGNGVKELFEFIGKSLLNNKGKENNKEEDAKEKKQQFSLKKDTKKKKKKCC